MSSKKTKAEHTAGTVPRNLSDYWRVDRSTDRSRELASILAGAAAQAEMVQRGLRRSAGRGSPPCSQAPVLLDPRLLSGFSAPIPGDVVDCVVGLAIREGALRELSAASSSLEEWPDLDESSRSEFAQLHRVLEEVYVSARVGRLSKTLAEYLRMMRQTLMPWGIPEGVPADSIPLTREGVLGLWIGSRLYGKTVQVRMDAGVHGAVLHLDEQAGGYVSEHDPLRRLRLARDIWRWLDTLPAVSQDISAWWSFGEGAEGHEGEYVENRQQLRKNARGGGEASRLLDLMQTESEVSAQSTVDFREQRGANGGAVEVVTDALREQGIRAAVTAIKNAQFDPAEYERVRSETAREIESVRRVFSRLDEARSRWRHGLRRGKLDGRGLTRLSAGKTSVFKRRDRNQGCSMALVFLVDVSASMRSHMPVVNRAACVVAEALRDLAPRVWYEVLTYTSGGLHQGAPVQLTRLAATGTLLSLRDVWSDGGTPTGEAIAAAMLVLRRRCAERKLVLHFTDGHPKDSYVVRQALELGRRLGIDVLTISVGAPQDTLYGEGRCEVAYSVTELPFVLTRLLPRLYH